MTAVLSRRHTSPADGADIADPELVKLVQSLPRDSEERNAACEELIGRYESLVRACAQRYRHSPESPEELMQVGYVGLLKAINNFDPSFGSNLASYAQPCIAGEIKRHFRDKRWHVHVKRSTQELRLELCRARTELTQQLSRAPKDDELAEHLGISDDAMRSAPTWRSRRPRWTLPGRPGRTRGTWPTSSARTIRTSSTPSTWSPSGRTGATSRCASSGS